ncbi:MAG: hypothetical protein H6642_17795 [Caldilineaceae bacterium]|nr:hypothetical protein [Caldilineaceae bacterium]
MRERLYDLNGAGEVTSMQPPSFPAALSDENGAGDGLGHRRGHFPGLFGLCRVRWSPPTSR